MNPSGTAVPVTEEKHHHLHMPGHHNQGQEQPKKPGHLEDVAALGAGGIAVHEHHKVKNDPEHANRHRGEEVLGGAAAVGAALDHHERKKEAKRAGA